MALECWRELAGIKATERISAWRHASEVHENSYRGKSFWMHCCILLRELDPTQVNLHVAFVRDGG